MQDFFYTVINFRYTPIIALVFVIYIVSLIVYMRLKKQHTGKWLKQNPDAVKIYINYNANMIKLSTDTISILSVDGEKPVLFSEKLKTGFYVNPGTHVIESVFTHLRPGLLYKTVSTTYGPVKQEITAESFRTYNYTFDKKEESYKFEVIGGN